MCIVEAIIDTGSSSNVLPAYPRAYIYVLTNLYKSLSRDKIVENFSP